MRTSRLSKAKQDRLIEHFVSGTTACCAADLISINFKTSAYYYQRLRELIAYQTEQEASEVFDDEIEVNEIEVDESYFGGHRKGNRGRGAGGKFPVFDVLKHGGRVYTKIILDSSSASLLPIIKRKVVRNSIIYNDCWRGYNVLNVSKFKHYRISHSNLFADKKNHINGIENFCNQAVQAQI